MSETLIVCGNYEGNLEAIAEVLNGWEWHESDFGPEQNFVVHDGSIKSDCRNLLEVFCPPMHYRR